MRNCLIFFVGEYSPVWPKIHRVSSQIQWRFLREISEKNYSGRIFQTFSCKPRLTSTETCEISPYFLQFLFCVRITLKKFTQVLSYVVSTQVRRHVHTRITKGRYGEEKPGRFVFGKPVLFTLSFGTYFALLLGCFGMKFWPNIRHCVYWLLAEIWAPDSSHKTGNKFFTDHCQGWKQGSFVCETVWFFSWVNTHLFDPKFLVFRPKFSGDSYVKFQEKTISVEFFRNFRANQSYLSSTETCEISPYFLQFLFCVRITLKKLTQVLSYVVCTQVRRHVHKWITKGRYREEEAGRIVSGKPILLTLGLGLTTPYSLGVLVWNFDQKFVTVSIEFWLRFEPRFVPQDWQ